MDYLTVKEAGGKWGIRKQDGNSVLRLRLS